MISAEYLRLSSRHKISNVMLCFRDLVRMRKTYSGVTLQTVTNKVRPGLELVSTFIIVCFFFGHAVTTTNCGVSE